ncbi:MAG: permease [Halobacteriales archaeon]
MTENKPNNFLFDLYERYIGEPETETDVYLGFGLFFVGVAFAAVALIGFVAVVALFGYREGGYYSTAQIPYTFALLAAPLTMLSVVVLLPVERRGVYGAVGGNLLTGVATVGFVVSYPNHWAEFGGGRMVAVLGTYAVGVSVVVAATAAALIAHQLEKASAGVVEEDNAKESDDENITMDDVRSDIDEAMEDVDLNLGGVERSKGRNLTFKTDVSSDEMRGGTAKEPEKTMSTGVDAQVQGLRSMKKGESKKETSSTTVDDQAAALSDLKNRDEDEGIPVNAGNAGGGETAVSWLLGKVGMR